MTKSTLKHTVLNAISERTGWVSRREIIAAVRTEYDEALTNRSISASLSILVSAEKLRHDTRGKGKNRDTSKDLFDITPKGLADLNGELWEVDKPSVDIVLTIPWKPTPPRTEGLNPYNQKLADEADRRAA